MIAYMRLLLVLTIMILSLGMVMPIYAQLYPESTTSPAPSSTQQNQVQPTDKGSIRVGFYTDPANPDTTNRTKFYISFLNKDGTLTQPHIDYKIFVKKGVDQVFGIPITHTAEGSVTIPFQFTDAGRYQVLVEVDGILFQPIPPETATFTVDVGTVAIPEFSITIPILLISMVSIMIFYKIKPRMNL